MINHTINPQLSPKMRNAVEVPKCYTSMRQERSVRVNLSVPVEIDRVLCRLAEKTGASKAALVMTALRLYLPALRKQLAAHVALEDPNAPPPEVSKESKKREIASEIPLSRAERRRLLREGRKMKNKPERST